MHDLIWFEHLSTTFVNITLQQSNEDPWTLKTNLKLVSSQLHLKYLERDAADWSGTTATHAASSDPWSRRSGDRSVISP